MNTSKLVFAFVVFAAFVAPAIVMVAADDAKPSAAVPPAPTSVVRSIDKNTGEHLRRIEAQVQLMDRDRAELTKEYSEVQVELCKAIATDAKFAPTDKSNCTVDTTKRKDADYGVVMLVKEPPQEEKKVEGK